MSSTGTSFLVCVGKLSQSNEHTHSCPAPRHVPHVWNEHTVPGPLAGGSTSPDLGGSLQWMEPVNEQWGCLTSCPDSQACPCHIHCPKRPHDMMAWHSFRFFSMCFLSLAVFIQIRSVPCLLIANFPLRHSRSLQIFNLPFQLLKIPRTL